MVFRQAYGLQVFPIELGNHHHNINHNNTFGLRERGRKNRWTSAALYKAAFQVFPPAANYLTLVSKYTLMRDGSVFVFSIHGA